MTKLESLPNPVREDDPTWALRYDVPESARSAMSTSNPLSDLTRSATNTAALSRDATDHHEDRDTAQSDLYRVAA